MNFNDKRQKQIEWQENQEIEAVLADLAVQQKKNIKKMVALLLFLVVYLIIMFSFLGSIGNFVNNYYGIGN